VDMLESFGAAGDAPAKKLGARGRIMKNRPALSGSGGISLRNFCDLDVLVRLEGQRAGGLS